MSVAKPTLGYPSRTAAVVALRGEGLTPAAIAAKIGIKRETVAALEHSARRGRPTRPTEEQGRTIVFPIDLLDELRPHAERRSVHVNALVRRLIECIVDDDLVTAVLGDADWVFDDPATVARTTTVEGKP